VTRWCPNVGHRTADEIRFGEAWRIVAFVICAVFAIFWAFVGWGMYSLKNWARMTTIVVCCLGIGFALLGVLASLSHFCPVLIYPWLIYPASQQWPPILAWAGVRIAVCALVIWYLLQARVRASFNGRPLAAMA
jgi:hypothetical protein